MKTEMLNRGSLHGAVRRTARKETVKTTTRWVVEWKGGTWNQINVLHKSLTAAEKHARKLWGEYPWESTLLRVVEVVVVERRTPVAILRASSPNSRLDGTA